MNWKTIYSTHNYLQDDKNLIFAHCVSHIENVKTFLAFIRSDVGKHFLLISNIEIYISKAFWDTKFRENIYIERVREREREHHLHQETVRQQLPKQD